MAGSRLEVIKKLKSELNGFIDPYNTHHTSINIETQEGKMVLQQQANALLLFKVLERLIEAYATSVSSLVPKQNQQFEFLRKARPAFVEAREQFNKIPALPESVPEVKTVCCFFKSRPVARPKDVYTCLSEAIAQELELAEKMYAFASMRKLLIEDMHTPLLRH